MTQQRDVGQDRQLIKDLGELEIHHPQACELYNHLHEIGNFWIEEGEAQRIRADKAQNKLNNLKRLLEERFPDLDFLYNIIVTDYPEGSNTDAKRD